LTAPRSLPRIRNSLAKPSAAWPSGGLLIPRVWTAALLFPAVLLLSIPAHGAEPPRSEAPGADALIASLQRKYETTISLTAEFEQENQLRTLGQTARSKGVIRLVKPGRIRVEYTEPERQLIVADGKRLWVYTPRLKQAILSEMGGDPSTPLLFLAGKGDLQKSFEVKVEEIGLLPRTEGVWKGGQPHRLSLKPRVAQPGFLQMWLEVDPQSYLITGLEYVDPLGNRSRMRFSELREGEKIPASLFEFQPPQGADVIRVPGPGARGR
jgi:outer membrane lipoprotein carrier protein